MTHELEIVNGQAQMAYVGEVPWHGLGTKVPEDISAADMMAVAGLDWRVLELESYVTLYGEEIPTGFKSLVRDIDGKVLTQVGANWNPVQNHEAFEFFNDFVEAGQMKMHTAGSLKGGEIVWALAKVDDDFELFNGDKVESYLLFSNPHQYGKCIDIKFTPIRTVCKNTLSMALSKTSSLALRLNHRKSFDAEAVKETMGIAHTKMDKYKEMAEFLGSKRYTSVSLDEFLSDIFGTKNGSEGDLTRTGETVRDLVKFQPGAEYAEGSWWQAYNAVTYFTDHLAGRSNDTRMQSAWFGYNQKKKVVALEKALEYAEAA